MQIGIERAILPKYERRGFHDSRKMLSEQKKVNLLPLVGHNSSIASRRALSRLHEFAGGAAGFSFVSAPEVPAEVEHRQDHRN
jgi:hypothetical protein